MAVTITPGQTWPAGASVVTATKLTNTGTPVITGLGTMAEQAASAVAITGGTATLTSEILDGGTGTLPATITNAQLRLAQANDVANGVQADSWGTGTGFQVQARRAGGTRVSPTATAVVTILDVLAYGHNGTSYTTTPSARYQITAPSLWSGVNQETSHVWTGTPSGSTTASTWMTLNGDGLTVTGVTVNLANLPTSAAGLSSGDVYRDSGFLKIV